MTTAKSDVTFYPNPTSASIMIFPPVFVTNVYDNSGKLAKKIHSETGKVSLEDLNTGQYYVEYFYLNKRHMKTVVKE
jgi:hypothetical protein